MDLATKARRSPSATAKVTLDRDFGSLGLEESMHRQKLAKRVALAILIFSFASVFVGFFVLGGTTLGFAMAFGGALLAYEAYLLDLKARTMQKREHNA